MPASFRNLLAKEMVLKPTFSVIQRQYYKLLNWLSISTFLHSYSRVSQVVLRRQRETILILSQPPPRLRLLPEDAGVPLSIHVSRGYKEHRRNICQ